MNQKELGFFIDTEIRRKYKSRRRFAKETKRSYTYMNKMLSEMIVDGKNSGMLTVTSILNDLGYELTIKEKDPTKK
ncbi:hypothetical protein HS141_06220 [Cetobacterium somerae]|uniref:hypothetical protein n=2 Tax=Cetobacterium TaxID=180162 RepID=UPI00211DB5AE|nr:hypothetical protein [Cetobacterium somerae]MCQ9626567.1 hypothetical protein [Cetobacterium somerae]WVJ01782.1 hypothetical protein VSU16_03375 [Cetobacterium somerae]